jgi:hypothetical protein
MANYSIPNSTPAIGRTSTPLSRRSRRQNSASASFEALNITKAIRSWALSLFNAHLSALNAQFSTLNSNSWTLDVGCWALGVFSWESEGCLVVLAVFKTVVGSAYRDRGRFDSYPLRQLSVAASLPATPKLREGECRGVHRVDRRTAIQRRGYSSQKKGGDLYVA